MPKRMSRIAQEYSGRAVAVGERFEVEAQDVSLLLAIGRIEPEEGEAGYIRRELQHKKRRAA